MVLHDGMYKIAVDVTPPEKWRQFYGQYSSGFWLTYKLYALSPDQLEKCPDKGRVYTM